MSMRRLAPAAVAAAIVLLTLGAASSPAATTVRTDPGGSLLTGPTTLRSTSGGPAVITTSTGQITCTQASFDAHLTANVSSSIIGGGLTALTFTTCTDTVPAIAIEDCTLHAPTLPQVRLTSTAGGGTFTVLDPTVRCKVAGAGTACYFTLGTMTGTLNNAASTLTFTNVPVTTVTPTADGLPVGVCGNGGFLSVQFRHIVDDANRTVTVTTA